MVYNNLVILKELCFRICEVYDPLAFINKFYFKKLLTKITVQVLQLVEVK